MPDAPTIGTATAGHNQASVAFSAPSDTGGSAITAYTVTDAAGAQIEYVDGGVSASTSVTLSGTNLLIEAGQTVTGAGLSGVVTVASVSGTALVLSSAQTIADTTALSFVYSASVSASPAVVTGLQNGDPAPLPSPDPNPNPQANMPAWMFLCMRGRSVLK